MWFLSLSLLLPLPLSPSPSPSLLPPFPSCKTKVITLFPLLSPPSLPPSLPLPLPPFLPSSPLSLPFPPLFSPGHNAQQMAASYPQGDSSYAPARSNYGGAPEGFQQSGGYNELVGGRERGRKGERGGGGGRENDSAETI